MTIQRRILAGHLAVAGLLLAPAIFTVVRLADVGERTRASLERGFETIRDIDKLRAKVQQAFKLKVVSGEFEEDPAMRLEPDLAVQAAHTAWVHLRPRI